MKFEDTRKYAIYSRKSKFTGKGESIENQIELCKQYLKINVPNVTDDEVIVFEDEGFSGGNINRPQFQRMMTEIESNQIQAVICYKLDRISRSVADFATMYKKFEDMNVNFWSVSEKYDTTTVAGRAMISMCTVFAQMERETIGERVRDNMRELAKLGRWLGGITPTGYKSIPIIGSVTVDGRERKAFKLEVIKEEAELVKLIYKKFMETNSLTKTETYLLQNHIKTKNGKSFTRFAIKAILQNPVYMIADQDSWNYFQKHEVEVHSKQSEFDAKHGIMAFNKTMQKTGKSNKMRDIDEWILAVGKHKGIIKGTDWVNAQKLLEQNSSKSFRKPRSNVALLSGLLYCGNCGAFMRPKLSSRTNANGERIYDYLCETKERSKSMNCQMKRPNGNMLDKMVCEEIKKLSEDQSFFISQLEKMKKTILSGSDDFNNQLENYRKQLTENESQINNLVLTLSKSENTPVFEYVSNQITKLHDENQNIKKHIEELEDLLKTNNVSDHEFELLLDLLKSFSSSFDTISVEQKRSAIRNIVKRVVWDGENIHLYLFGSDDSDIDFSELNPNENKEPLRGDSE